MKLRGFAANEVATVKWFDTPAATPTTLTTGTASSLGSVTTTITIPQGAMGAHQVEAVGNGTPASDVSLNYTIVAER